MDPASVVTHNRRHALIALILEQLRDQLGGRAIPKLSVATPRGVTVADVGWLPEERWREALQDGPMRCPPIVVLVLPMDKSAIAAVLDAGASEVVVIDLSGAVRYYRADGEHTTSAHGLALSAHLQNPLSF